MHLQRSSVGILRGEDHCCAAKMCFFLKQMKKGQPGGRLVKQIPKTSQEDDYRALTIGSMLLFLHWGLIKYYESFISIIVCWNCLDSLDAKHAGNMLCIS